MNDDYELARQWLVWLSMAGRGVYSVDVRSLQFLARCGDPHGREFMVHFDPEGLAAHFEELVQLGKDRQYVDDFAWHALADLLEDELRYESRSEVEFSVTTHLGA